MQTIAWNKHGDSLSEYTLEEFCFFRLFARVNEHQKKKKKKKNRTLQLCSEFCTTPISVWRSPTQLPQQQLPQKQLPQNPDCRFDTSVAKCDWRKINWSKQIVSPPLLLLNKRIIKYSTLTSFVFSCVHWSCPRVYVCCLQHKHKSHCTTRGQKGWGNQIHLHRVRSLNLFILTADSLLCLLLLLF